MPVSYREEMHVQPETWKAWLEGSRLTYVLVETSSLQQFDVGQLSLQMLFGQ